eukprot:2359891-Alexandrium_andersonii.AAC.1
MLKPGRGQARLAPLSARAANSEEARPDFRATNSPGAPRDLGAARRLPEGGPAGYGFLRPLIRKCSSCGLPQFDNDPPGTWARFRS